MGEFDLLGHSFGGFVCTAWASRNPSHIRNLGLLSPLLGYSDERIDRVKQRMQSVACVVENAWAHHITPQALVRWVPGVKGWFERASARRFQSMAQDVTE